MSSELAALKFDLFQPLIHGPHVIEKWSTSQNKLNHAGIRCYNVCFLILGYKNPYTIFSLIDTIFLLIHNFSSHRPWFSTLEVAEKNGNEIS